MIKSIRRELHITQIDLAHAVHVSFSTVNRWENHRNIPNRMARTLLIAYCEKNGVDENLINELRAYK